VVAVGAARGAHAEVYSYKDRDGVVHFTNHKVAGAKAYAPSAGDESAFGGEAPRFANTPRMWTPVKVRKNDAYDGLIQKAARRYELPPALLKAIMATESGFSPNVKSHAGACGLMQLMPQTAKEMGVTDIFSPEENVMGGARYIRYLINYFQGNVKLAVAAYNAGPSIVSRVKRVPEIPETKSYVTRVLRLYGSYRRAEMLAFRR